MIQDDSICTKGIESRMENRAQYFSISARPFACRLWQGDEDWLVNYCRETGRKPAEVARELFSEAVRLRSVGSPPDPHSRQPESAIIDSIDRLGERLQRQEEALGDHYGLLLEILMAFCQTRNLIWRQSGLSSIQRNGKAPGRSGTAKGDRS
jgi:hypothetical protein